MAIELESSERTNEEKPKI